MKVNASELTGANQICYLAEVARNKGVKTQGGGLLLHQSPQNNYLGASANHNTHVEHPAEVQMGPGMAEVQTLDLLAVWASVLPD